MVTGYIWICLGKKKKVKMWVHSVIWQGLRVNMWHTLHALHVVLELSASKWLLGCFNKTLSCPLGTNSVSLPLTPPRLAWPKWLEFVFLFIIYLYIFFLFLFSKPFPVLQVLEDVGSRHNLWPSWIYLSSASNVSDLNHSAFMGVPGAEEMACTKLFPLNNLQEIHNNFSFYSVGEHFHILYCYHIKNIN